MKAGAEASTGRLFFSSRPGGGKNLMRVWHIYSYENICVSVHGRACLCLPERFAVRSGVKWPVCPRQTVRVWLFLFCAV